MMQNRGKIVNYALFLCLSCPVFPIQIPVADGFCEMRRLYELTVFEVSNGACHFQYTVVGAGRKIETVHCIFQQCETFIIRAGIKGEQFTGHLCIAVNSGKICIPVFLDLSRLYHAFAYHSAGLARSCIGHLLKRNGHNLDLQVDAVEQGTGYTVQVFLYLPRTAYAGFRRMVVISAGAWIHRSYQHKTGRIFYIAFHTGDRNFSVLQRLAEYFQYTSIKFRQFAI